MSEKINPEYYKNKKIETYEAIVSQLSPPEVIGGLRWQMLKYIMRFGEKIQPHMHSVQNSCYLSAHFTVQCNDTSTCYINPINTLNEPEIYEEKNKAGSFSIFPSYIPHYTTRHYSFKPRITIAMDIVAENWENNWILL